MYQVEDEPIETIHLYVMREEAPRPQLLPIALSILVLLAVIVVGVLVPYQQPEVRTTIRIPAVLLPLKIFTASIAVIPTGSKTVPATQAQGVLTIYNGSIIAQELPQGLIVIGKDSSSTEVVTQYPVTVPPGNPPSFGVASVRARTDTSGARGNIQAYDINEVYGSSLYIRNLHPFTGGKDAQTISFITPQDRQHALSQARATLTGWTLSGLLYRPCAEQVSGTTSIQVRWTCQFFSYTVPHLPGVKVLHVSIAGTIIILEVSFTPRQPMFPGK